MPISTMSRTGHLLFAQALIGVYLLFAQALIGVYLLFAQALIG
jgi:hypothetical protein